MEIDCTESTIENFSKINDWLLENGAKIVNRGFQKDRLLLRECEGGEPRAESLSDTDSFFQVILEPRSDTQSRKTLEQDAKEYRSSKREGCPPELINRSYIRKV